MRMIILSTLILIGCNEPYSTHDRELGRVMDYIQDSQTFNLGQLDLTDEGKGAIESYWQNLDSWSIIRKARVLQGSRYEIKLRSKSGKEGKVIVFMAKGGAAGMALKIWPGRN